MANGKRISEQSVAASLKGGEMFPFAKNGDNGAVSSETIKEYVREGIDDALADKVDKVDGKGLSANDYTDADKAKLDALPSDSTLETALDNKVDKVDGKGLSANDFTDADKTKLDGIEAGAQVNTVDSVNGRTGAVTGLAEADDIPTKVSELANDSAYQTEAEVDNKLTEAVNGLQDAIDTKVDKVTGKQLSTEDFTTLLKQKLEGLTNYDDTELTEQLDALKQRLDTLVGSDNATAVIDTFQEIEAFLQGITNTQTLTGLLQEMKEDIMALCANTYLPKNNGTTSGQFTMGYISTTQAPTVYRSESFGAFIKYSNSDKVLGYIGIGSSGEPLFYKEDDITNSYTLLHAGNYSSVLYRGTSSQFVKADGSVDSTSYLPTSGGTLTGNLEINDGTLLIKCTVNSGSQARTYYCKDYENNRACGYGALFTKGVFEYSYIGWGVSPWLKAQSLQISDTLFQYKGNSVWHSGNDGAGSGLDADLLDGKQPADLNVGSAGNLTANQLTTENLNDVKSNTLKIYWALNTNTCSNTPVASIGFSLQSMRIGGSQYLQIFTSWGGVVYKRYYNSTSWSDWQQLATTNSNVASADKLTTTALTDEDLNDFTDEFKTYHAGSANTCANKPTGVAAFKLIATRRGSTNDANQILISSNTGHIYYRVRISGAWGAWKKMLTEDDIIKITEVSALPASPDSKTLYCIPE